MGENIVVINGKRYDARTGKLVSGGSHMAQNKHKTPQPVGAIDGLTRRPAVAKAIAPAHGVHRKLEKSQILMRGAVKKPASSKVHTKAHTVSNHAKPTVEHKQAIIDNSRLHRATSVPKSSLITRFGASSTTSNQPATKQPVPKTALLPVKHAPPISEHHNAPLPLNVPNPFAQAIENANSHQQISLKKQSRRHRLAKKLRVSPRTISAGSMVLAGLLFGGFFVYQNIPNLAVRVAAARSGVPARLPAYKPAGFALDGPIKYSAGKISINYHSTTDDRNFAITQSTSEWNDEALLDNFVAIERRAYQTYQDKGKTIFIYEDDNATWVEDGVWYQVEGASSLNSDQLLRIANSL